MRGTWLRSCRKAIATALVVGVAILLASCALIEAGAIRAVTEDAFNTLKNPTEASFAKYLDSSEKQVIDELEGLGIDPYDLFAHAFRHFDYKVGDVAVNGDKATVQATLANASLEQAFARVFESMEQDADFAGKLIEEAMSGDGQEVYGMICERLFEELDGSDDIVSTDLTIRLTKANGEWSVDEDSMDEVVGAMLGGSSMREIESSLVEGGLRTGIAIALNALKSPTGDYIDLIRSQLDAEQLAMLEESGADLAKMLQHMFSRLECEIGKVRIEGNTASVDVTTTNVNLGAVMQSIGDDALNDPDLQRQMSTLALQGDTKGVYKLLYDHLYQKIDESDDMVTSTTTVTLRKNANGVWEADEKSLAQLGMSMLGGVG